MKHSKKHAIELVKIGNNEVSFDNFYNFYCYVFRILSKSLVTLHR